MNKLMVAGTALVFGAGILASSAAVAQDTTTWLRKGDQEIVVVDGADGLLCTRTSDGFEMCHGMVRQADGTWAGPNMKHPDMPKFLTFDGTVIMTSMQLKIEGCMIGGAVCDAEVWDIKP